MAVARYHKLLGLSWTYACYEASRDQHLRFAFSLTARENSECPKAFRHSAVSSLSPSSTRRCFHGHEQQAGKIRAVHASASATDAGESAWTIQLVPCLSDNYAYLLLNTVSKAALAVDPSEAASVAAAVESAGARLSAVLCTHHHRDHTGGNLELKDKYGLLVVGPAADKDRIPGIDVALSDGDTWQFEGLEIHVLHTPGHTRGHCSFYLPSVDAVFTGDTLFSLGCGRLFEGTPQQMLTSLSRLAALPPTTSVFCGHEYTQANARFALSVEPSNRHLQQRVEEVKALRSAGLPTIPTTIATERATNPFLRSSSAEVRQSAGLPAGASEVEVLAAVRRMKDHF